MLIGPNIVGAFVLCSLCLVELMKVETINSIIFPIETTERRIKQLANVQALLPYRQSATVPKQYINKKALTKQQQKKYTKH